jgi:catechol 2,3-dioxygenase-like lactoylglutathione lyase family enzyme
MATQGQVVRPRCHEASSPANLWQLAPAARPGDQSATWLSHLALRRAGEPTGEAVLSVHLATDVEVEAALQEAVRAGGVVVKPASPTPMGGSYGFIADPDGHLWEVIHHPLYRLGADGRPEIP